jgi:hypothetical protein
MIVTAAPSTLTEYIAVRFVIFVLILYLSDCPIPQAHPKATRYRTNTVSAV